jgi:hypothetical protein
LFKALNGVYESFWWSLSNVIALGVIHTFFWTFVEWKGSCL